MSRTLFVGDVHGCARELGELLGRARPTRVVMVGDLFTKGPDPLGVWRLIQEFRAEAVLGNHDAHVLEEWTAGRDLPHAAFDWLEARPWLIESDAWIAVHAGVRPRWRKTRRSQAMGLRALPKSWGERYDGKRLVIHGHDSRRGLLDNRPFTLGLDTGCAKGGSLTGYLHEEDRLISVSAMGSRSVPRPAA